MCKNSATTIRASFCIFTLFLVAFQSTFPPVPIRSLSLTHIPLCPFEIYMYNLSVYICLVFRKSRKLFIAAIRVFSLIKQWNVSPPILLLQIQFQRVSLACRVFLSWRKVVEKKFSKELKSWLTKVYFNCREFIEFDKIRNFQKNWKVD